MVTFGVVTGQHQLTLPQLGEQWRRAETLGFDSIWLFDHFLALYGDPDGPCLEASTLLAALALTTTRVQIGVLVYGNTHRHPAVLAKEVVTVDHLAGGRAILGIGAGWNEGEHAAYGLPFPSAGERVARLDEALDIMKLLFSERRTTFAGRYYHLQDAPFHPKPVRAKLPILIGGNRSRMLKVVAKHADFWDCSRTPDGVREGVAQLRANCAEIGRDPTEIAVSVSLGADKLEDEGGFAETVRAYHAAGAAQLLFDFPISADGEAAAARVARDQLPALRAELG
jgi:alkanesulfonate monooxygenase SsuD/methylene tetrahydromethanopterin reductase-like flavin-dependent oxidoreductase (luciferase family)